MRPRIYKHARLICGTCAPIERFADFQALGGIVEEGREIVIDGLPASMRVHHAGSLEDPEFNNAHLAIRWPD